MQCHSLSAAGRTCTGVNSRWNNSNSSIQSIIHIAVHDTRSFDAAYPRGAKLQPTSVWQPQEKKTAAQIIITKTTNTKAVLELHQATTRFVNLNNWLTKDEDYWIQVTYRANWHKYSKSKSNSHWKLLCNLTVWCFGDTVKTTLDTRAYRCVYSLA